MAGPNPNGVQRVLVCDTSGNTASAIGHILKEQFPERNFEISTLPDLNHILNAVEDSRNPDWIPYYSLIAYASDHVREDSGGMKMHRIKEMDPFLPQLTCGPGISRRALSKAFRRGARWDAETVEDLKDNFFKIFYSPTQKGTSKKAVVSKVGGSSFDKHRIDLTGVHLRRAIEQFIEIRYTKPSSRDKSIQRQILTVGAGQFGDIIKDNRKKHHDTTFDFPYQMSLALELDLRILYSHIEAFRKDKYPDKKNLYHLLNTEDFYFLGSLLLQNTIPLMSLAPYYVLARDGIPLADSDTHTLAIAELVQSPRVVLLKRTDGIYKYDPNRGLVVDYEGKPVNLPEWIKAQEQNELYNTVTLDDLLSTKISREGTGVDGKADGSTGHLMEESSLRYFAGCKYVKEILVVHIAPEEMHYNISGNTYRHIFTGNEIKVDSANGGWTRILRQNIDNAVVSGKSNSRIVRE